MQENQTDKESLYGALRQPEAQKTAGERIHNELTYRGLDWIANTAFAVGFSYWANYTTKGQEKWSKPAQEFFVRRLKPIFKDHTPEALEKSAAWGVDFANIIIGGSVIIPPIMVLDRKERPVAEWLDRKIYGDERVDNDERFAIRYEAIEQKPHKGFGTGMLARGVVLTPMILGHVNKNTRPYLDKYMYQPVANTTRWATEKVGLQPQNLIKEGRTLKDGTFESKWDFIHNTLGFDTSLTFIYSFAHEWTYKGLTNLFHKDEPQPAANLNAAPPANQNAAPEKQVESNKLELKGLMQPAPEQAVSHG